MAFPTQYSVYPFNAPLADSHRLASSQAHIGLIRTFLFNYGPFQRCSSNFPIDADIIV